MEQQENKYNLNLLAITILLIKGFAKNGLNNNNEYCEKAVEAFRETEDRLLNVIIPLYFISKVPFSKKLSNVNISAPFDHYCEQVFGIDVKENLLSGLQLVINDVFNEGIEYLTRAYSQNPGSKTKTAAYLALNELLLQNRSLVSTLIKGINYAIQEKSDPYTYEDFENALFDEDNLKCIADIVNPENVGALKDMLEIFSKIIPISEIISAVTINKDQSVVSDIFKDQNLEELIEENRKTPGSDSSFFNDLLNL